MNVQPIIIIGMHRSGTTMLSQVLERHGLFQGWKKEENNESTFFIKLNNWVIRELGGRWDSPEGLVDVAHHSPEHLATIVRYLKDQLDSPRAIEYLGLSRYWKYHSVAEQKTPWSWKDPRSSLVLDIWLRIFQEAKVIHVIRHGVDVANSLMVRTRKYLQVNAQLYDKRRPVYSVLGKRGIFVDAPRCLSLEGGFFLWEKYVEAARRYKNLAPSRYLEVRFEDLLVDSRRQVETILEYCGLNISAIDERYLNNFVDKSKGGRFMSSPELVDFSRQTAHRWQKFGY